ncbi:MAG: hypothetical protein ACRBDI_00690 [Alphaproteobacteria bacterium]
MNIKTGFMIERGIHYFIMAFVLCLIGFSVWFVFMSVQAPPSIAESSVYDNESDGKAKPLPDFIVDKVPADELESLKP